MEHAKEMSAVALFFLIKRNGVIETLLGLGKPDKKVGANQWNAPGGRVNPGESIRDACIREIREEIAVSISADSIDLGSYLACTVVGKENLTHLYIAIVRDWQDEPQINCDEFTELKWFPINNLPFNEMIAGDRHWVERFLQGEYVRGRVCHGDKTCVTVHDIDIEFSKTPFDIE